MGHQSISFIKSGIRIIAGAVLLLYKDFTLGIIGAVTVFAACFILAEIIGVIEEFGQV